jgi:anaerobic selenocysteine-containing dehydrogenase
VVSGDQPRAAGSGAGADEFRPPARASGFRGGATSAGPQRSGPHHTLPSAPFLPFAQGNFRTPSGKAELYSEAVKALGLDPVADFIPPTESRHRKEAGGAAAGTAGAQERQFSEFHVFESGFGAGDGRTGPAGDLCPDARARGIADGDRVRVFNDRGDILLKARVDGKVQPGVVSASLNWAKMTPGFQSINASPQKNLPTWATRPRFIPSWLR